MTDILMPKLSDLMEQGLILQWLIEDGHAVNAGDELLEIETDKATMTWEAESAGKLTIVVQAGQSVAVGAVIARVGDTARAEIATPATPALVASGNGGSSEEPLATPIARRLAAQHGVALASLHGTGPRGRITKADVLHAAVQEPPAPAPPTAAAVALASAPDAAVGFASAGPRVELTRTQQLIADRMTEAKATVPHFQVQTEVAMDRALALREEIKQTIAEAEPAPSINDLIVRASALALRAQPRANGSYRDDGFELHQRVNVGIAVAAGDALLVPTVFDADAKPLTEIAADTRRAAGRVRAGQITPQELSGATFTISNLGMYGMTAITPVINPPQAAILGVGAIRSTLAREGDKIVDRSLLTLTLCCDHRILYGADAAQFLADLKQLLEWPLKLLL